jgi:hypothetical protein
MKFLIISAVFTLTFISQSCYTVIESSFISPDVSNSGNNIIDNSIIEGTVVYKEFSLDNWGFKSRKGFVLENYKWLINTKRYLPSTVWIKGNIDSSFINNRVQIKGTYKSPKSPSLSYHYSFTIIKAEKIFIID